MRGGAAAPLAQLLAALEPAIASAAGLPPWSLVSAGGNNGRASGRLLCAASLVSCSSSVAAGDCRDGRGTEGRAVLKMPVVLVCQELRMWICSCTMFGRVQVTTLVQQPTVLVVDNVGGDEDIPEVRCCTLQNCRPASA